MFNSSKNLNMIGEILMILNTNRLIDMVGSVFRTKVIRYFHQVIQGGNIDEERYYL